MPKAYLNILFFDEQFNFVPQNSEIVPVSVWDTKTPLTRTGKEAVKNGYAYIYVSNESNNLVYFDNLQVSHNRGPVLEETHYYPFGLTMAGISSKAAGGIGNRYKYNGKEEQKEEFSDGSGLELLDFGARMYSAQIGRWLIPDPLAKKYQEWSVYVSMANNPISKIDPTGKEFINFDKDGKYLNSTKNNWWHNFWNGHKGRVLDDKGNAIQKFTFADAKHDIADIKAGIINRVEFVKEADISTMLSNAGVFNPNNKIDNSGDRYSYIMKDGKEILFFVYCYSSNVSWGKP